MRNRNLIRHLLIFMFFLILISSFLHGHAYSRSDSPAIPVGTNPCGIAISPSADIAVIANEKSDSASFADLASQAVFSTIPVGKSPSGVAIDTELNMAVISNSLDNSITIIDLNNSGIIAVLPVGKEPAGIAINPLTHLAVVANHKDNNVTIIDLVNLIVKVSVAVGKEPIDVGVDPELNIALVVNEKDYSVSVIDLSTYQVIDVIPTGKKPGAIDIDRERHVAGVVDEKDNSLTGINLLDWQAVTFWTCKHPVDIAMNQLDGRALIVCDEERKLQVIDISSGSIITEYPLNKLPKGIAVNNFTNIAAITDDKTDSLTLISLPNPVPAISSLNPETLTRGSKGNRIIVRGSGFIKKSAVTITGASPQPLEPVFIDNDTLEVIIPDDLLQNAGQLEITVTNSAPAGGKSNASKLTVINPAPQIAIIDPPEVISGSPGVTLTIHGTGFFPETTMHVNSELKPYTLVSNSKLELRLTDKDLEVGGYIKISASNPAPGGGTSAPAVFTVKNPIPLLIAVDPATVPAGGDDYTLHISGNNFVKTSVVSFNGSSLAANFIDPTHLEAIIPATLTTTAGQYPVTVINPLPGGGESESLMVTVKPPIEIKIASPADGATVNDSGIIVRGTIKADTEDMGVIVNGYFAQISGNEWLAVNIPIVSGENTITASITDSGGNIASASVTVFRTAVNLPVSLTANVVSQ